MKMKYKKGDEGIEQLLKATAKSLSIISSRGQLTVPQPVRELCKMTEGTVVAFEPQREGVLLKPLKVIAQDSYTPEEWKKIEKLHKARGISFASEAEAIKHLDNL